MLKKLCAAFAVVAVSAVIAAAPGAAWADDRPMSTQSLQGCDIERSVGEGQPDVLAPVGDEAADALSTVGASEYDNGDYADAVDAATEGEAAEDAGDDSAPDSGSEPSSDPDEEAVQESLKAWSQLSASANIAANGLSDAIPRAQATGAAGELPETYVFSGTYEMAPTSSSGQRVDVNGSPLSDGISAGLYHDHAAQSQKWQFTRLDNGRYLIASLSTGKVLGVCSPEAGAGASLQLRDLLGTRAEEWILRASANGSVRLQNAFTGLYIDVPYGNFADYANALWQWDGTGVPQQNFYLYGTPAVDDGYYTVTLGSNGSVLVESSGNAYASNSVSGLSDVWEFTNVGDGTVLIKNANSMNGLLSSVAGDAWVVRVTSVGGVSFLPAASQGQALTANGGRISLAAYAPTTSQLWLLSYAQLLSNGSFAILTSDGGAVGLSSWSQDDGAYYTVYGSYWEGDAMHFLVASYEDNAVSFQNRYSGKYLTADGVSVRQYSGDGSGLARFKVVSLGNGQFAFRAADGTYLTSWGVDIGLGESGAALQSFSLMAADSLTPQQKLDKLFAVAAGELWSTNGRKYENALLDAGGQLCYTWDFWCATYLWWVFREAGLSEYFCGNQMMVYPQQEAAYYTSKNSFGWYPKPGDLAFYYFVPFPGGEYITHTELVISVDWNAGTVTTIGGNPQVCYATRSIWDYRCRGYAGLNWGV